MLDIIQSMKARMPWNVAQKVLFANDLPRGMGWERTIGRIEEDKGITDKQADDLVVALREHIVCGEKMCVSFEVDEGQISALRVAAADLSIPKSVFADAYPMALSGDEIKDLFSDQILCAIEQFEHGTAVVFSSARAVTIQEAIDTSTFEGDVANRFSGYQELLGIKTIKFQAFDIVWLPSSGKRVDILVDFPKGNPPAVATVAHQKTLTAFENLFGDTDSWSEVNYFPLISSIYNDTAEGSVVELSFGTSTSSLKNEKMRRQHLDLRDELYHIGGKEKLQTPIDPFRISVFWNLATGDETPFGPEVSINARAPVASGSSPVVTSLILRRCQSLADFEMVRARLEAHLTRASAGG